MADIVVPQYFKPRDYQLPVMEAIDGGCKRVYLKWHRRAGKDTVCWAIMCKKALERVGNYYYCFVDGTDARKAIWEAFMGDVSVLEFIPKGLIVKISERDLTIELVNGSRIRLLGTSDLKKLRGMQPVGVVLSEFAWHDPTVWTAIFQPILAFNDGWIIINSTPQGHNHFYELGEKAAKWDDWFCTVLTVEDTGAIDNPVVRKEIERARELEGEHYVQQEYYVDCNASVDGAYYGDCIAKARLEDRIGIFDYDPAYPVETFWDIGQSDDTVIWFAQRIGNKIIFIDYHEDRGKNPDVYIELLFSKEYRYSKHWLPHDGRSRKHTTISYVDMCKMYADSWKLSGYWETNPKPSRRQDNIIKTRARFGRYYFNEGLCKPGIDKLALYRRRKDTKKQVYMDEPHKDWTSHAADAFAQEAICERALDELEGIEGNINIKVNYDYNPFK